MSNRILFTIIAIAIFFGVVASGVNFFSGQTEISPDTTNPTSTTTVACATDAVQCPDGLFVGRSGPACEFVCPAPTVPADIQAQIIEMSSLITVTAPGPMTLIKSPIIITGSAKGNWFFEGSAPIVLVDWDGNIIAEGTTVAQGEWMTEAFVPFSATLSFTSPYSVGDEDFMKRGTLVFKKDNPSGLPEHDSSLEIPVLFE